MPVSAAEAPDLTGLVELSRERQLDLKPVVLRVQTDLFLAAPIRDRATLEAFASLANGLIPVVDDETALIVARKLGPSSDTPASVRATLAARGGEIAQVIALPEPVLPQFPLPEASASPELQRDEEACGSDETDLPGTEAGDLDEPSEGSLGRSRAELLAHLLGLARKDAELAGDLLERADLADADLASLWLHADAARRLKITAAIATTAGLRTPPPASRALGTRLCVLSERHDVAGFVSALAHDLGVGESFLGVTRDAAARYDLLTIALRAAGLEESEAIHVFLTLNEAVASSVTRVFSLRDLFRSMDRSTARDLLGAILGTDLPERETVGQHVGQYARELARPRNLVASERASPLVSQIAQARRQA